MFVRLVFVRVFLFVDAVLVIGGDGGLYLFVTGFCDLEGSLGGPLRTSVFAGCGLLALLWVGSLSSLFGGGVIRDCVSSCDVGCLVVYADGGFWDRGIVLWSGYR